MTRQALWNDWMYPLCCTFLTGISMSVCAMYLCFLAGGGGHGSLALGAVFYGPVAAVWMLLGGDRNAFLFVLLGAMLLYPLYGVIIAIRRRCRHGITALWLILLVHYTCTIGVLSFAPNRAGWPDFSLSARVFCALGYTFSEEVLLSLATFHLVAFQFASGERPYRPRLTRWVLLILGAALVAGTILYGVTCTQGGQ